MQLAERMQRYYCWIRLYIQLWRVIRVATRLPEYFKRNKVWLVRVTANRVAILRTRMGILCRSKTHFSSGFQDLEWRKRMFLLCRTFLCLSFNLLCCVKSVNIWRILSTLEPVFSQILVWILRYRRTLCSHNSQAHSKSRKVPITYVIRPYDCPSACIISVPFRRIFLKFYAGDFY